MRNSEPEWVNFCVPRNLFPPILIAAGGAPIPTVVINREGPPMPAGHQIQIRVQPAELRAIDQYRRAHENPPSRGEAVRELMRVGLRNSQQAANENPSDSSSSDIQITLFDNAVVRLVEVSDAILKVSAFGGHELHDLVSARSSFTPKIADSLSDLKPVAAHGSPFRLRMNLPRSVHRRRQPL